MTDNQRKVIWVGLLVLAPLVGASSYAFAPRGGGLAADFIPLAVGAVFVISALFVRAGRDPKG